LWVCRGWGRFLVQSELLGWPHSCAELDGNGFFLGITSFGNFLVNKNGKNIFRKVPILACFLVKNIGGINDEFCVSNGFSSHLHNICLLGFLFYMKFNNVYINFSTNLTNIHKCREKKLFPRRNESKKNPEKK
jgi:hypothetical protein